jgi:hypothetical protein
MNAKKNIHAIANKNIQNDKKQTDNREQYDKVHCFISNLFFSFFFKFQIILFKNPAI